MLCTMPPVPHYLSATELIVDIDFADGRMLIGELTRRSEPDTVYRYTRWSMAANGSWKVERPSEPKHATLGGEWLRGGTAKRASARVYFDRVYVDVDRKALVKALDNARKLTNKAMDVDGLVTLDVHARGLSLYTHGARRMHVEIETTNVRAATDRLGTVVVLGEALRSVCKALSPDFVQVQVDPARGPGRCVQINTVRLWTVHETPMPTVAVVAKPEPIDLGLTPAITRALAFASADASRPNLNCVLIDGRGDHVFVVATDGHRLYRERVVYPPALAALGTSKHVLPRAVLESLRSGRRGGAYRFAFDGHAATIVRDGNKVECNTALHVFPPHDQVVSPLLYTDLSPYRTPLVRFTDVSELRRWVVEQVKADRRDATNRVCPIELSLTAAEQVDLRVVGVTVAVATSVPCQVVANGDATIVRLFGRYFADALAVFADGATMQLAAGGELDPVYCFDATRVVCTMPTRW